MKKLISLVMMFVTLFSFAACGKGGSDTAEPAATATEGPQSLAIAVQYAANTAEPMLTSSDVVNLIYDAALHDGSSVTLLEADGAPYTVDSFTIKVKPNVSVAKKQAIAKESTKAIISSARNAQPKTKEVDTLKALNMAARNIDRSAEVKTIMYLGSGLQTCGELPFATQNLLDSDVDVIINQLKSMKAIPEFPEGTRVVFAGIGDVALPQKELTYENVAVLKEIWQRICEEGGADVEFITATPTGNVDTSTWPQVSTVKIHERYVEGKDMSYDGKKTYFFDSESIEFEPDSFELSNPAATEELLTPIVEQLKESGGKIRICGTTATVGSNESCIVFSQKRSATIADLFLKMGLNESQMKTLGLGYENSYHVPDVNPDGSLIDAEAAKNRLVIIMDQSSDEAQTLIGG